MIENAEYKSHLASLKMERVKISYHVETLRKCCVRLESMKLTRHELLLAERSFGKSDIEIEQRPRKENERSYPKNPVKQRKASRCERNSYRVIVESVPVNVLRFGEKVAPTRNPKAKTCGITY